MALIGCFSLTLMTIIGCVSANRLAATTQPSVQAPWLFAENTDPASQKSAQLVWDHLAQSLELPIDTNQPRMAKQLKWIKHHPQYFKKNENKSNYALPYVVQAVQGKGMPAEVALLPFIESNYNPLAFSLRGAAGIWQLMPETANRMGIEQNWWYDGRRDLIASTDAALNYLNFLQNEFNHDWLLAFAAYNAGEGTVKSAIAKNIQRQKPTDFFSLDLPRETRQFVPKILSLAYAIKHQRDYSLNLPAIKADAAIAKITLDTALDLTLASTLADLSVREIYALNPGFNRFATPPNGQYTLLLPIDKKAVFEHRLAAIEKKARVQFAVHKVKAGESIIRIAKNNHISPMLIKRINHLQSSTIKVGQHLYLPEAASRKKLAFLTKINTRPHKIEKITHLTKKGDSLYLVAARYHVSVDKIKRWNNIHQQKYIFPGQKLVIFAPRKKPIIYAMR